MKFTPHAAVLPAVRTFAAPAAPSGDVIVPELVDTLEWVIESPPNIHQFDEPPVSTPHLDNKPSYNNVARYSPPLVTI